MISTVDDTRATTDQTPDAYRVVTGCHDLQEFMEDVNRACAEGWKPIGGISVTRHDYEHEGYAHTDRTYYQAMTRD